MRKLILAVASLATATAAFAADHVVVQNAKAFSVKSLNVKVGDTLSFHNEDPFVHNIFSLSDAQSFDLGTFAKGEVRQVKLTAAGELEIECAVHPEMKFVVQVKK